MSNEKTKETGLIFAMLAKSFGSVSFGQNMATGLLKFSGGIMTM
jgi:hypothetical protein